MPQPRLVCLPNGAFVENCYLLADEEDGVAAIVDPGEDSDLFLSRATQEDWTITQIWLTHAHLDHVAGVAAVARATGAPILLHPDDRFLYDEVARQASWLGVQCEQPPPPNRELRAGDTVAIGEYEFAVRPVPGHSPGSVAFVRPGLAVVGDTLFAGGVGRVDLPGGDGPTLLASIQDELLTLPDDTLIYPGHGPETTVGRERVSNPFLTGAYPLA